jgi:hypothetical protein
MWVKPFCRILVLVVVTAYVGATTFPVAPTYAANADMSSCASGQMIRYTRELEGKHCYSAGKPHGMPGNAAAGVVTCCSCRALMLISAL